MPYTVLGSYEVESSICKFLHGVAEALRSALGVSEYRAVVLLGGYGRGEGGVEISDGRERPHNNFDLLVICRRGHDEKALRLRALDATRKLAASHDIGIDVGCIGEGKLRRSPCLVMWYDMRFGHKTLLGDPSFVPSLTGFRAKRIVPSDVRNLIVNRGTLLVINDLLLERGELTFEDRRTIIKHGMKAILGYGDALLFFKGAYDWSYVEKRQRMKQRREVDASFRALYDQAMEFRFSPKYAPYERADLGAWNDSLRGALAPVHLACEAARLRDKALSWQTYPRVAFRHALFEDVLRPKAAAKKALFAVRSSSRLPYLGLLGACGARASGPRDRLSILFPLVAYRLQNRELRDLVRTAFGADGIDFPALRRAYLREWGLHGDINFASVVRKHNLMLETSP